MEAATPTRGQKNISVLRKVSDTPQCARLLHLKEKREERRGEEKREKGEGKRSRYPTKLVHFFFSHDGNLNIYSHSQVM